jgi:hypothetical protein
MKPGERLKTIRVRGGDPDKGLLDTGVVTGATTMRAHPPKSYFPTLNSLTSSESNLSDPTPQPSFKQRKAAESEYVYEGPISFLKIPEMIDSDSPFVQYSIGYNRIFSAYNGKDGFAPLKDKSGKFIIDPLTGRPRMRPIVNQINNGDLVIVPHLFFKGALGICEVLGLREPFSKTNDPASGLPRPVILSLAQIKEVWPKKGITLDNVGLAFIQKLSGSRGLVQGHPNIEDAQKSWNSSGFEDPKYTRMNFAASDMPPQNISESTQISRDVLRQIIESVLFDFGKGF